MHIVRRIGLLIAGLGLVLTAGVASRAFAASTTLPSGAMNLKVTGSAVMTPTSGSATTVDILGIGQLHADTAGTIIAGALTYTAVNDASATQDVCTGTVTGSITPPTGAFASGDGWFSISLNYAPSSSSTGTFCIPSTASLLCTRSVASSDVVGDLDGGKYGCLATSVTAGSGAAATIDAATLRVGIAATRDSPTS